VTTRTYLHILINLTIWPKDRGGRPTTVSPDIDIEPMLGAHKWPSFISNYNGHKDGASVIFEYNWRKSVDPNTHVSNPYGFDSRHGVVLIQCQTARGQR